MDGQEDLGRLEELIWIFRGLGGGGGGGGSHVTGPTTFSLFAVAGTAVMVASVRPSTGSGSRLSIMFQNTGDVTLFVKSAADVSTSNGIRILAGEDFSTSTSNSAWWAISDGTGTSELVVAEDVQP